MIVEILQLYSILVYHNIHLLIFFFIFFALLAQILIKHRSNNYKNYQSAIARKVSVVVPVYTEDHALFKKCLESIAEQKPDQIIVSMDGKDKELEQIARKYAEVITFDKRVGKRPALVSAWKAARNEIIVHVDSDVILEPHCLEEITKPFDDPKIAGVSTWHTSTPSSSRFASVLAKVVEANMNINGMGLNNGLVVVDGRCNAWRKEFLLSLSDVFLEDLWMGRHSTIGDDRFLSRQAIKNGYKTVIQNTAKILIKAPDSFSDFLRQQVRWRRSGTKFFIKDLYENVSPSFTYSYKCFTYYTRPFIFAAVAIIDWLFFRLPFYWWAWAWWQALIIAIIGATIVAALLQSIYHRKPLSTLWLPIQAITGLFIMLPLNIYAELTVWRQDSWVSRGDKDGSTIVNAIILAISFFISMALIFPFFIVEAIIY